MILHNDFLSSFQKTRRGRPAGSTRKAKFMAKQFPLFPDSQKESLSGLAGQGVGNPKPVIISFRTSDHE
jgi:hypothetical protein